MSARTVDVAGVSGTSRGNARYTTARFRRNLSRRGAMNGDMTMCRFDRRTSLLIHALAVAIISAIAWRYHDPALVLAYVSGVIIELEMST